MQLGLKFDGDEFVYHLEASGDWGQFRAWAEALPDEYSDVCSLAVDGECRSTERLFEQLESAGGGPEGLVQELCSLIGVGAPDEAISIVEA